MQRKLVLRILPHHRPLSVSAVTTVINRSYNIIILYNQVTEWSQYERFQQVLLHTEHYLRDWTVKCLNCWTLRHAHLINCRRAQCGNYLRVGLISFDSSQRFAMARNPGNTVCSIYHILLKISPPFSAVDMAQTGEGAYFWILYSGKLWWALNLVNQSWECIGEFLIWRSWALPHKAIVYEIILAGF